MHSLSDTPCHRRRPENEPGPVLEGIGLAQERRLRSRKRTNKTEEDKWRDAYKICFPDDILVPSPCKLTSRFLYFSTKKIKRKKKKKTPL